MQDRITPLYWFDVVLLIVTLLFWVHVQDDHATTCWILARLIEATLESLVNCAQLLLVELRCVWNKHTICSVRLKWSPCITLVLFVVESTKHCLGMSVILSGGF